MFRRLSAVGLLALMGAGCSIRQLAIQELGDALSKGGTTFAADEDPELVGQALPFSLKLIESLLAETPNHRGLLLAASSGFTQYSYGWVHQEAEKIEDDDLEASTAMQERARKLYLRARNYGLRGLSIGRSGFSDALRADPAATVQRLDRDSVPFLYWTAAAWGLAISLGKDDPTLVADLPIVQAMIDRALQLDETYEGGAIHNFLISYELVRPGGEGDPRVRAKKHFDRSVELSAGLNAAPLVTYAEQVSVANQNRAEFEELLNRALAVDINARPEWRLANVLAQRRAKWLLDRTDDLFLTASPAEEETATEEKPSDDEESKEEPNA